MSSEHELDEQFFQTLGEELGIVYTSQSALELSRSHQQPLVEEDPNTPEECALFEAQLGVIFSALRSSTQMIVTSEELQLFIKKCWENNRNIDTPHFIYNKHNLGYLLGAVKRRILFFSSLKETYANDLYDEQLIKLREFRDILQSIIMSM